MLRISNGQSADLGQKVDLATATSKDPELPFFLEERAPGIAFDLTKESFYHPYALLQSMRWREETLTLHFVTHEIEIKGRGLYLVYSHIAAHRVARLTEQGERYETISSAAIYIAKITQLARGSDKYEE